MKRLIVTEKSNAAKRIADILSVGKAKSTKLNSLPVFTFDDDDTEVVCVGLKGHILKVDFPREYSNWQNVDPKSLINADILKVPTKGSVSIIKLIQKEARKADEIIIATDFDREGELIGADAVNKMKEVNKNASVKRARFSALTDSEIKKAFSELEEIYHDLASAGEARQDIDLIWGATLTRFISLASSRLGKLFLSVGRVQSPTLALTVLREKERQAFISTPYWQIKAIFRKDGEEFVASHKTERFLKETEAQAVLEKLKGNGRVISVSRSQRKLQPPAPFNTTAFLTAASSIGVSPSRAMRIAENLYINGLISYPRVDNTVYPSSLDFREILTAIKNNQAFGEIAAELAEAKKLTPTRGKLQATDHPPIHPTGLAQENDLKGPDWKIYQLVARRFLATLSPAALVENASAEIEVDREPFVVKGSCVVDEGWLRAYPYSRRKDEEIPDLRQGDEVELVEPIFEAKETQPPARYSQGRLIQKMEELGLGTKATRHQIIQNLYDRGYTHSDPIVPTELGMKVAESLLKHTNPIATSQMTAELEKAMDQVADGQAKKSEVVDRSRTMLAQVMNLLDSKKEEVGQEIRQGIKDDRIVGKCPNCDQSLRIIRSKKTKKRFVGCGGYPDCKTAYPLPQFGEIISLNEYCDQCQSPKIKVLSGKGKAWVLCIDPKCPSKGENNYQKKTPKETKKKIGRKTAKKPARKEAKTAKEETATTVDDAAPEDLSKEKEQEKRVFDALADYGD